MNTTTSAASNRSSYLTSIFLIGVLFFVFGFVTWLNGTLIPFLKLACELKTDTQAFFVTFAFYMAYFFLALPSSSILKRTGFKNGMALGLVVMAIGSLIFIPAANSRAFGLFLTGLFVQGAGLALLQTASNPYISVIGPIESAAQRISIMGICNKVAGALSPIILGAIVLNNATALEERYKTAETALLKTQILDELAQRVIMPYAIIAVTLIAVALMIRLSPLPEISTDGEEEIPTEGSTTKTSVFQYSNLVLGVLCLFLYVGVEVMAGDVIGTYGRNLGFQLDQTRFFTTFTLLSMLVGYIFGIILIPKYMAQETGLRISAILGIIFTIGAFLTTGIVSVSFIALLGLANALMWPAIFPLAIKGLGKFTNTASALLVMGIAGGAVIPILYGKLAESISFQTAFFIIMIPCYIYILYYAISGHKVAKA
jgi:glucose/galactose transporter